MRPVLWDVEEVSAATGAELRGAPETITGISIDSRTIGAGDLFIAI